MQLVKYVRFSFAANQYIPQNRRKEDEHLPIPRPRFPKYLQLAV
jgi:hypothetical protein